MTDELSGAVHKLAKEMREYNDRRILSAVKKATKKFYRVSKHAKARQQRKRR